MQVDAQVNRAWPGLAAQQPPVPNKAGTRNRACDAPLSEQPSQAQHKFQRDSHHAAASATRVDDCVRLL